MWQRFLIDACRNRPSRTSRVLARAMKAEHISIAQQLEDIPHVGDKVAALIRGAGVERPSDLEGLDALWLYNKICNITRTTHSLQLLDRLLAAIAFADGGSPKPLRVFSKQREAMDLHTPGNQTPGNKG